MANVPLTSLSAEEFDVLLETYIERIAQDEVEMPASVFFELLFERLSERVEETIVFEVKVVDGQIVIEMTQEAEGVWAQGNEIFVDHKRLVFHLRQPS